MTTTEIEQLLRYAMRNYPSSRMSEQQFNETVQLWSIEFGSISKELMGKAFRLARLESDPNWMPTIPKLHQTIRSIESKVRVKSDEQEFKDAHCGKSRDEWENMIRWEQSQEGSDRVRAYKDFLSQLIGG